MAKQGTHRKRNRRKNESRTEDWTRPDPEQDREEGSVQFARILNKTMKTGLNRGLQVTIILLMIVVLYYQMNPVEQSLDIPETDLNPIGKQEAWDYVTEWLDGQQLGDNAAVVSWDGADEVELAETGSSTSAGIVHSFTVCSDSGWWLVTQTVREDDLALIGNPSVQKADVPDISTSDSTPDWPNTLQSAQPSTAVSTLVSQWAQALMGDDSDALTVLMNDDPNASYTALGLGDVDSATVEKMSYLDAGNVDNNNETSDRAAARVTITLAAVTDDTQATQFTYDVLIGNPDGTPSILAWGAPGTGDELEEYANRSAYEEEE